MAGTDAFRATVGAWAEKLTLAALAGLARASIQDMAEGVIEDTPVDTGYLRGSWQPSLNAPNEETSPEAKGLGDAASGFAGPKIALIVTDIKIGEVFYYTNAVEYAKYQEFGTSKMAGRFMVSKNVARWQGYVSAAAVRLGYTK